MGFGFAAQGGAAIGNPLAHTQRYTHKAHAFNAQQVGWQHLKAKVNSKRGGMSGGRNHMGDMQTNAHTHIHWL